MKPKILRQNLEQEFYTEEKCYITELSNSPADPEVSIARARVKPGVTTCWHHLKISTERYIILQGQGRVEIGDLEPEVVNQGDTVIIPPLCRQRIENVGTEDLIFLAICTPPFEEGDYVDLEG